VRVRQRSAVSKRLHRPLYSGERKTLPRNVRVMGRIVAGSAVQVVDAVRPRQGGRDGSRRCGARLYPGSYVTLASSQSARPVNC